MSNATHLGDGWFKASASDPNEQCVKMRRTPAGNIAVASTRIDADAVIYDLDEIKAFVAGVKAGEFDFLLG
jgi:hypothetical protein